MKYIITESQYNKAIDKFITSQFEPHEQEYPVDSPYSVYWIKNGKIIAEVKNKSNMPNLFRIDYSISSIIMNMFGLDGKNEVKTLVKEWYKKHYGIEDVTIVITIFT